MIVVIQRCNRAELLVDNKDRWETIDIGLIVYVAFSGDASMSTASNIVQAQLKKAALAVLNLPLLTLGMWGDGSDTRSLLSLAEEGHHPGIMIIPQAALGASMDGKKHIKYNGQVDAEEARVRYESFIDVVCREAIFALDQKSREAAAIQAMQARLAARSGSSLSDFFRVGIWTGIFSEYDETGLPTKLADGKVF
jgi:D-Tyr-tRNAtyr deacylase